MRPGADYEFSSVIIVFGEKEKSAHSMKSCKIEDDMTKKQ